MLFVSSEIFPLAKTGGLADVANGLPRALDCDGDLDMLLMLPGYPCALAAAADLEPVCELPNLPGGSARLLMGTVPDSELRVLLLDQPSSFARDGGLYVDAQGNEWPDNPIRFAALSHAAVRVATGRALPRWRADLVHCHDWHTALVPLLLSSQPGWRPRTILTLHNLAFQGLCRASLFDMLGLPEGCFSLEGVEFYGQISFLKGGINHADKLTTVSPSYADEITSPEFGMGLEGVLARRKADLHGIMNGIDDALWNPAADRRIPAPYSADDPARKAECKRALQESWGLIPDPDAPLLVFAARLEEQKMADTLLALLPDIVGRPDVQVAILGRGARHLEAGFAAWPARAPGRVAAHIGYTEERAHQLLAGGDMLVHGSRFEPCGLTPLYAMRYGAVPIVRAVGGLRDSVTAVESGNLADGTATGFWFVEPTEAALLGAIDDALALFRQPHRGRQVQTTGMRRDFSWRRPAGRYRRLYEETAQLAA